jgi:hypothetical protein
MPYHVTRSPLSSKSSGQGRSTSATSASAYNNSSDERRCLMVRSQARRVQGLLKSQNRSLGRSPRRVCEKSTAKGVPAKTPSKQLGQMSKLLRPCRVYQSSYLVVGALLGHDGSGLSKSNFAEGLAVCSRRPSTLACDRTLFDLVLLVRDGSSDTMLVLKRCTSSRRRGDPEIGDDTSLGDSGKA